VISLQPRQKIPRKPKLLRSNALRFHLISRQGISPLYLYFDDEDILVNSRRFSVRLDENEKDDELSDYVKLRLFLARQLALLKYQEKWG